MTGGWFSGGGNRQADLGPAQQALDGAAQALIDLDTRQNYVDAAIRAVKELSIDGDLGASATLSRDWAPIAEQSFRATAEYLDATNGYPFTDPYGRTNSSLDVEAARRAFVGAHRLMADAAAAVDRFYQKHREEIEGAKRKIDAVPQQLAQARQAAAAVTEQAAGVDPALLDRRVVTTALDGLSAAMSELNSAAGAPAKAKAAAAVQTAAAALGEALTEAPELGRKAKIALPSVRTRLDGLATKIHRLPAAQSTLWREFAQANSADLAQHGARAEQALAAARSELAQATTVVDVDPESAHDYIAAARAHAGEADHLIDDVTGRLDALRDIRSDPRSAEHPVRFAIRDAQRLVVDRRVVPEWGSVLDAQSTRVDRAMETLDAPHPNYWSLLSELAMIRAFVADIVDRVRKSARS